MRNRRDSADRHKRAARGRPLRKVKVPRKAAIRAGSAALPAASSAATLRPTAAPVANVKSEIHMRDSLVLVVRRDDVWSARSTPQKRFRSPELGASDCIEIPFCGQKHRISTLGL
jgi:hypothetical protein